MAQNPTTNNDQELDVTSYYSDELDQLDKALVEMEALYDETKEHYDEVKNSRTKGSLSFVHLQLGNLISMKNARLAIIKEKVSIKKTVADYQIKEKKAEGAGAGDAAVVAEVMRQLNNQDTYTKNTAPIEEVDEEDAEDAIERRINELEGKGKLKFTDNEKAVKYEKSGVTPPEEEEEDEEETTEELVKIVVVVKDKKWSFAAVNELGRIVKGHELPNKSEYKMKLTKVDGELIAIDQDDRMYDVIRK